MANPRKNKIMKSIWFESEKEYKNLTDALDINDKEKVLDIMFAIYLRRDL